MQIGIANKSADDIYERLNNDEEYMCQRRFL